MNIAGNSNSSFWVSSGHNKICHRNYGFKRLKDILFLVPETVHATVKYLIKFGSFKNFWKWLCPAKLFLNPLLKAAFTFIYRLMVNILIYILRSNTFFYCTMTIYIPLILFKSNRVWFEKYKSGISFVS